MVTLGGSSAALLCTRCVTLVWERNLWRNVWQRRRITSSRRCSNKK
ncbi:hypothetical protein MHYP_G00087750, partial [Metynnis hypsauchen]